MDLVGPKSDNQGGFVDSNLLAKLRKVLALTDSPVEAEAQTAASILQRLLTEHNLSMADLEQRGTAAPRVHKDDYDLGKAGFNWKLDLAEIIAEHYYCHPIVSRYSKTVSFVGRPDNVESLKMLYGWIMDQIKRISKQARERHTAETGEHIDPLRWQVSFGEGAVQRLDWRLREQRDKDAADNKVNALVVHHKTEISDWLEENDMSRIDGRRTAQQQRWDEERKKAQAEDERLKAEDIEAYYAKYPWERPETDEERTAREKKESRRKPRAYRERYLSPDECRKLEQAGTARASGQANADKINLRPFIGPGKKGELE